MRHGAAGRRSRNRGGNGNRRNNNNRMQVFDSNGPDVRIRGTAFQILEKYTVLAKDAAASGDRILSESYLQHAEHYQRIINVWQETSGQHHHSNQQHNQNAQQQDAGDEVVEKAADDLGLPASIVGARKPELEDA